MTLVFAPPEKIASDSHEMSRGAAEDSSGDEYESDEDYDDDDDEYSEEESEEESEPPGSHPLEGLPVPMPAAAQPASRVQPPLPPEPAPPRAAPSSSERDAMAQIRQQYGIDSAGPMGLHLADEDAATQASTAQLKKTENRLELAFEVCGSWPEDTMSLLQFRKALGVMGKRFTEGQIRHYWRSALMHAYESQVALATEEAKRQREVEAHPDFPGGGGDGDDGGKVKKAGAIRDLIAKPDKLCKEEWRTFFMQVLVRGIDHFEMAEHFRSLVEGTRLIKEDKEDEKEKEAEKDRIAKLREEFGRYPLTHEQMFMCANVPRARPAPRLAASSLAFLFDVRPRRRCCLARSRAAQLFEGPAAGAHRQGREAQRRGGRRARARVPSEEGPVRRPGLRAHLL